jgi:hypothetical protein
MIGLLIFLSAPAGGQGPWLTASPPILSVSLASRTDTSARASAVPRVSAIVRRKASRVVYLAEAASPLMTKSQGLSWGKQLPEERPRETAET